MMKHTSHRKRLKRKLKRFATAVAGAVVMSAALFPGASAPVAHAASNPNANGSPVTTTQRAGSRVNRSGSAVQLMNAPTASAPVFGSPPPENVSRVAPSFPLTPNVTIPQTGSQSSAQIVHDIVHPTQPEAKAPTPAATTNPAETKQQASAQDNQTNAKPATPVEQAQPDKVNKDQTANPTGQAPDNYQKVLNVTATAYAPGAHDNDQWGSKTYIGSQIRPGVIAVDPSVIPIGSRVYIQYPDGHGVYAVAEDTGGAIKGNRIDVAKWTVGEAEDFGIQNVKVYVLNQG